MGLASHIGVCADVPTVGVAKKLFHVDGILRDEQHHRKVHPLMCSNVCVCVCVWCVVCVCVHGSSGESVGIDEGGW